MASARTFNPNVHDLHEIGRAFKMLRIQVPISTYDATTCPVPTGAAQEDITRGWKIGSKWIDTVQKILYFCIDNSVAGLRWVRVPDFRVLDAGGNVADAGGPIVDNAIIRADGTLGSIQGSVVTIDDSGVIFNASLTSSSILDFAEAAQDAVGAMVGPSLVYVDGTPLLARAALTGDVTAAQDSNATTIANDAVTYAKMQNISAESRLLGRGQGGGSGDTQEISLGSGLSMTGTTLTASGSGNVTGPGGGATDNAICRFDGASGLSIKNSVVTIDDTGVLAGASIAASQLTGIIPDARMPDLTGDVTTSEGEVATTIANNAVTLAKLQNAVANSRLLGSGNAGAGVDYVELQIDSTLSLSATTLSVAGNTFLRQDGTVVAGGGAFGPQQFASGIDLPDGQPVQFSDGGTGGEIQLIGGSIGNTDMRTVKVPHATAQLRGTMEVQISTVGNAGTGEDLLHTWDMPAYTLSEDERYVEISCAGTCAANANTKRLRLYFGATAIYDSGNVAPNNVSWFLRARVYRKTSTTQRAVAWMMCSATGNLAYVETAQLTSPAETLTAAVTIRTTMEATSDNDGVEETFCVETG